MDRSTINRNEDRRPARTAPPLRFAGRRSERSDLAEILGSGARTAAAMVLVAAAGSSAARAGVVVDSASSPMLDGTPTVVAGEPLDPCVVLEGCVAMKLIDIEDFGAEQEGGPAFARVTYSKGRERVVEDVMYWRVAIPRADAAGALADLSMVPTPDGGVAVAASLAHRTDRPLHEVDHGTLSLTIFDRVSGASARLTTWGEWVGGDDGLMEYATLSSPVNCVSLSDFTGDVPSGSPLVGALAGGDERDSDIIWILQGQGLEGDFTFSAWGGLVESPTAVDDVKALADAAGWTTQELEAPELISCTFGGWILPPVQPCIWTVQPAPDNGPAVTQLNGGSASTASWTGMWSQSGVASAAGARLSKSQVQDATLWGFTYSVWSPAPPFFGLWNGELLIDRTGDCGECPCQAQVTAFPSAAITATLDADATFEGTLAASITAGLVSSSTLLDVSYAFLGDTSIEAGITEGSVVISDGGSGTKTFSDISVSWPAPLNVTVGCGSKLFVTSGFAASGSTHLSGLVDFPWRPHAAFEATGSTRFKLKVVPVTPESGLCGIFPPVVLKWSDPIFPE